MKEIEYYRCICGEIRPNISYVPCGCWSDEE